MADVRSWLKDAAAGFGSCLEGVADDQWSSPTPDVEWDVRALVAHLVDEQLWAPPLLAGRTIEDIGDEIPSDPLGDDPRRRPAQRHRRDGGRPGRTSISTPPCTCPSATCRPRST